MKKTAEGWANAAFNNRDPVYLQVVRHFKEGIATGRLTAGQTIPSRRELAALLKINPNTAQKAYKEMEDQRLIVTEGNSPSRITQDASVLRKVRSELIDEAVGHLIASIRTIDVSLEELLDAIRSKYAEAMRKESGPEREGGSHD
jgi:DNA-binding transcriptional regulator YhcF (GntR family)